MKSITQNNVNDKKVFSLIIKCFKTYKVFSILKASKAYKCKEIPVIDLLLYL